MAARYSDQDIDALLQERKLLPDDYQKRIILRNKRGHKERELDLHGINGNRFRLILRESDLNVLDFSIILAFCPKVSSQYFRLRRYNGKSHEHTNRIEGNTFYNFHIHIATERYQELGTREDAYAEPTDCFSDLNSAVHCMIRDCGFEMPKTEPTLFDEIEP